VSLKNDDEIRINAPAKVNLYLDIVGKRDDGYHLINSVFQTVSLYDTVTIRLNSTGDITVKSNVSGIPEGRRNTAYKAAELFLRHYGLTCGADIFIEKRIPDKAGLGGGSSDAAAVLHGLNKLCRIESDSNELCKIAVKIGADVPFFIKGGTTFVGGIGENITSLKCAEGINFVIAKGNNGISTADAYGKYDNTEGIEHSYTTELLQALSCRQLQDIADNCFNVFEQITDLTDVFKIKDDMIKDGAMCALMSGSGSAVFGIFENKSKALKCCDKLKKKYEFVTYCTSV
jgi:4-diphosphocytidyl-2-C-methyl-D-erythritol kinase